MWPAKTWTTCSYYQLDGNFNPDVRTVNDTREFSALPDVAFYSLLAWTLNGSSTYSLNAAKSVKT